MTLNLPILNLDDSNLVCHVQSIVVRSEANVGLLVAVRPDQGVDLLGLDVVHLLDGILDLLLGGPAGQRNRPKVSLEIDKHRAEKLTSGAPTAEGKFANAAHKVGPCQLYICRRKQYCKRAAKRAQGPITVKQRESPTTPSLLTLIASVNRRHGRSNMLHT